MSSQKRQMTKSLRAGLNVRPFLLSLFRGSDERRASAACRTSPAESPAPEMAYNFFAGGAYRVIGRLLSSWPAEALVYGAPIRMAAESQALARGFRTRRRGQPRSLLASAILRAAVCQTCWAGLRVAILMIAI